MAEHFGVSVDEVEVVQGDTLVSGFESGASGQRLTTTIGQAIAAAADKMKQDLTALAAERLNCAPSDIRMDEDGSFSAAGATIDLRSLMGWAAAHGKAPFSCQGENAPGRPTIVRASSRISRKWRSTAKPGRCAWAPRHRA